MTNLLWVAAGGAIGAILRYVISMKVAAETGGGFPWGTLTVNMIGCLVIGLMWSVTEHKTTSDVTIFDGWFDWFFYYVFDLRA